MGCDRMLGVFCCAEIADWVGRIIVGVNRIVGTAVVMASVCAGAWGQGKTPSPALLVLSKEESFLAIVDPATLKVVGKVDTGASARSGDER
jgi:hypothetical protein